MMIKRIYVLLLSLLALNLYTQAQETGSTPKKHGRPDIPGTFVLELGLNRTLNSPDKFDLGLWGSRAFNIYYQYDMRILKSKFSFHPGIGFGLERYKFRNNYILNFDNSHTLLMSNPANLNLSSLKKSQLITNYLDIPLELRFSTNPEDPTRSFKVSVGGRVGFLFDSFTKYKYVDNGDKAKVKQKEGFNLNQFRYGLYFKIGAGNFSLFSYYNLSPLFKSGKGPISATSTTTTEMNNFTVGISLSSF